MPNFLCRPDNAPLPRLPKFGFLRASIRPTYKLLLVAIAGTVVLCFVLQPAQFEPSNQTPKLSRQRVAKERGEKRSKERGEKRELRPASSLLFNSAYSGAWFSSTWWLQGVPGTSCVCQMPSRTRCHDLKDAQKGENREPSSSLLPPPSCRFHDDIPWLLSAS